MKVRIYKIEGRYFAKLKCLASEESNCRYCDISDRLCQWYRGTNCGWGSLYREGTIDENNQTFTSNDGEYNKVSIKKKIKVLNPIIEVNAEKELFIGGVKHCVTVVEYLSCTECPLYEHNCGVVLDSIFGESRETCGKNYKYKIKKSVEVV